MLQLQRVKTPALLRAPSVSAISRRPAVFFAVAVAAACGHDAAEMPVEPAAAQYQSFNWSAWSTPVKLGPVINVPQVTDGNAMLSPDGLSLYYDSDRNDLSGAQGARDIWVSRRACTDWGNPACEWQTPVNLGPNINSPYVDAIPVLSGDGHLLFFLSHGTRPGCPLDPNAPDPTRPCRADIFVSWRSNPKDDLGWGPAVALPPPVNTSDEDNPTWFASVGEPGGGNLYIERAPAGGTYSIHVAPIRVTARGAAHGPVVNVLGPVVPLSELNQPNTFNAGASIRADSRELFFMSNRPGMGGLDIWTSTRRSPHDPWGVPTNVSELNSIRGDINPTLSRDGQTLLFTSNRDFAPAQCAALGLPNACGWDIYVSTRTRQR